MNKEKKQASALVRHVMKYKYKYLLGMLTLLVVDYLDLFIPQYIGEVTDGLSGHTIDMPAVLNVAIKMLICAVFISIGRFLWRYFINGSAHKVIEGLRNDMFEKLETLSQNYFNHNKTGDIMAYFTNDLESIQEAIGWSVISAFDAVVLVFMCLYKMMNQVSVTLTLVTLIPMTMVAIYGYFISGMFERNFQIKQDAFGKLTDAVQEAVTAERVIKAFVQEEEELEAFKKVNKENRAANLKIARLRAYVWPVMETIIGFAYIISIVMGGYYCLIGNITLGGFVAFASYVNALIWPMFAAGDCIAMFSQAVAANKRINRLFDEVAEIQDPQNPDDMDCLLGGIKFDDASFKYDEDLNEVLENISVEIKPGETFAIMGRTGSGKTTFVNLLTRLYDTTKGTISFDGHDIKNIPLHLLHSSIAYVPQDNFLFSESLKENIAFGKLGATMEEIEEASKIADIHDNISEFPEKYETMVGERGVTLSGGQKQRSSIARAIIKDAPILIMDDSLSAVDTDTEDRILANLKRVREGKTTIMIAHRVSTVQKADHILVLENGKAIEYGNYEELMALNGVFAKMAIKQQLEKQLAVVK